VRESARRSSAPPTRLTFSPTHMCRVPPLWDTHDRTFSHSPTSFLRHANDRAKNGGELCVRLIAKVVCAFPPPTISLPRMKRGISQVVPLYGAAMERRYLRLKKQAAAQESQQQPKPAVCIRSTGFLPPHPSISPAVASRSATARTQKKQDAKNSHHRGLR
jgi:hypothetical protein